jgi:hypothetical protein
MTMRATTQRNANLYPTATNVDPYGNKVTPDWEDYLTWLPCYVWYGSGGTLRQEDKDTITVDTARLICPLDTDILITDRIAGITDRLGVDLFGAFTIRVIHRRKDHLEISLSEAS